MTVIQSLMLELDDESDAGAPPLRAAVDAFSASCTDAPTRSPREPGRPRATRLGIVNERVYVDAPEGCGSAGRLLCAEGRDAWIRRKMMLNQWLCRCCRLWMTECVADGIRG